MNIHLYSSIHSFMPRTFFLFETVILFPESYQVGNSFFSHRKKVVAMYEQTPEFFMKFRRPRKDIEFKNDICYAFGLPCDDNECCDIEQKHYLLLLESSCKFP